MKGGSCISIKEIRSELFFPQMSLIQCTQISADKSAKICVYFLSATSAGKIIT